MPAFVAIALTEVLALSGFGWSRTQTEMRPSAVNQWSCEEELHVGSSIALPQVQPPPGIGRIARWISRRGGCERTARSRSSYASSEETVTALPKESAQVPRKSADEKGPPPTEVGAPDEQVDQPQLGLHQAQILSIAQQPDVRLPQIAPRGCADLAAQPPLAPRTSPKPLRELAAKT
eukprot:CAMPEP_0115474562 /NCGR_PEP_ID=MMETSP0271-20121206/54159_1 /TAXON_ID=71861 /ORGANISM="Scrippsiella trochoidea, Strain CCMP3099" /LENGTH=176 /DNA_ID=CAMNT_0002901895 /DNA_START=54 /DNA_END=581 /DNA_ORIENTATION=-